MKGGLDQPPEYHKLKTTACLVGTRDGLFYILETVMTNNKPTPEECFALRMMMIKYNMSPLDLMKTIVALEKEKPPKRSEDYLEGGRG